MGVLFRVVFLSRMNLTLNLEGEGDAELSIEKLVKNTKGREGGLTRHRQGALCK